MPYIAEQIKVLEEGERLELLGLIFSSLGNESRRQAERYIRNFDVPLKRAGKARKLDIPDSIKRVSGIIPSIGDMKERELYRNHLTEKYL